MAKLDVAYFALYRPEVCGTSIWDDLHKLSETIFILGVVSNGS